MRVPDISAVYLCDFFEWRCEKLQFRVLVVRCFFPNIIRETWTTSLIAVLNAGNTNVLCLGVVMCFAEKNAWEVAFTACCLDLEGNWTNSNVNIVFEARTTVLLQWYTKDV